MRLFILFCENQELVEREVQQSGEAKSNQVTYERRPLEQEGYGVQQHHLQNESRDAGEVVFPEMAEERALRFVGYAVPPDIEKRSEIIDHDGALEGDHRGDDVLLDVVPVQKVGRKNPEDKRYYRYLKTAEGEFVGEIAYHYDKETKAYMADVIIHAAHRGKGYGSETADLAIEYARENLSIQNLFLRVFTKNLPAIKSYEHAGFVKYEDLPAVECSDGQKSDMILMKRSL